MLPLFEILPNLHLTTSPVLNRLGGRVTIFCLFAFQSQAVWNYCLEEPLPHPSQCTQQSGVTAQPRAAWINIYKIWRDH